MKSMLLTLLLSTVAMAQTAGTVYKATFAGVAITGSPFASLSAATTAESKLGPGPYVNTPYVTTAGTPTTFTVGGSASPSGTAIIAPSASLITDAKGNTWGISAGAQITLNGSADASTQKVLELAYVAGEVWQESAAVTPPRWWGTVAVPAVWLPAGGTLTSPLPTPACAAAPAAASCPAGTWTSSPYPTCWTCTPATTGGTTRPAYNTGNGFYVLNGKLYDANGNPFIIRGVDRAHYDIAPNPGLALTHANAQRVLVETNYGASVASLVAGMTTNAINYKQVPIPVTTITPAGADTSCSSDPAVVAAAVANWVATASSWTTLNKYMLLNIANEWGPTNSTVWRDSNISAVTAMRKAGYLGTLVIDSGGCGQDINDLANYSAAVFAADPQKNIIFSLHEYGESLAKPGPTLAGVQARFATLGKLQTTVGAVYAVLEFGPGNGIGPSPTNITPAQIVAAAEANGLGWAAWAWDDNDLANCMGDNNWFDMQINACTGYTGLASQLTLFGQAMLPFLAIAQPATIFATTTNASVKAASPKLRHP